MAGSAGQNDSKNRIEFSAAVRPGCGIRWRRETSFALLWLDGGHLKVFKNVLVGSSTSFGNSIVRCGGVDWKYSALHSDLRSLIRDPDAAG